MKKILLCTALMSIMLFAGGCGRRTVTMPTVDEDTGTTTEQTVDSGGTLAEQLRAEERWEEELALNGTKVTAANIHAAVSVPDTDHMCVLTMKADAFIGERKKTLMEAVCDADSVYVLEEDAWPEWYAEREIRKTSNYIDSLLRMKESPDFSFDESAEELLRTSQEYLEKCKEKRKNAVTQGRVSTDYQEDTYYGIRDGKNIMFDFDESGNWVSWDIEENASSLTVKEGIDELAGISYYGQENAASENLCAMSEEQAVQAAENFLEGIGYSDYGVYAANPLCWSLYDEEVGQDESWTDGYSITFTRNVDGTMQEVGLFQLPSNVDYIDAMEERYGLEEIEVSINDKGILKCHIRYPYSVEEISASATPILSYEQVQGIFQNILQNEPDKFSYCGNPLHFNSMDLIYFRVADTDGDTYALLPVWILSNKEGNASSEISYDYALMINAIDGSQIDYIGELYELTEE